MNAINRRSFLATSGSLVVAFSLAPAMALADGAAVAKTVAPDQVDGYIAVDNKGLVTLYSGKVDLGTGVRTAMTQIVAEELDVPMDRVTVIEGDTALTPDQGPSYGSNSIQKGGMQIRQAAATARAALLQQAATTLGVAVGDLTVKDGSVTATSGKTATFGALIGGKSFSLKLDPKAPLKNPSTYSVVGTSVRRLDIPPKVFATFTYMHDFKVPGMLHGRVVRPPAIGAALRSFDEASIADIPGVVKIVRDGNFLGVVARTEWAAIKASRQLKTSWSSWDGLPDEKKLWEHVRGSKVAKDDVTSSVGDAATMLTKGAKRLKATYDFAIHTHGSIGPSCAVASFAADGQLTCWTASQATHNLVKQLATMLAMPADKIRCVYIDGSGCYGRNGHEDAAADAVMMAKAVGQPVRVQWMREDEHGWDPKGPPTLIDLDAALDDKGDILAWSSEFFIPQGAAGTVALVAAGLADKPHETILSPGGITGNSAIPYAVPNIHTVAHRLETTPLRPSWIRTPGRLQNTYANESFMDELAAAAGVDPFAFHRRALKDPRGLEVLDRLEKLADWKADASAKRDKTGDKVFGRGMSYVKYELIRTYVGGVADVEVDKATGVIRVVRFFVVQDCGQIINPDGIRNQLEGNVIQTVSRTLKEQLTFDRSHVTSLDWASYPIITFPDVPEIVMDLIDRPTEPPWGSGEPSAAIVPSAISNAVFDATGARMRSVPYLPEKMKTAMQRT
jgi:nicotinate dehydrogenase subunit B